jgi:hypothetical protein
MQEGCKRVTAQQSRFRVVAAAAASCLGNEGSFHSGGLEFLEFSRSDALGADPCDKGSPGDIEAKRVESHRWVLQVLTNSTTIVVLPVPSMVLYRG